MKPPSETPRTDAALKEHYDGDDYFGEETTHEAYGFARELERENNELRRDNENHKISILCLGKELEELNELKG